MAGTSLSLLGILFAIPVFLVICSTNRAHAELTGCQLRIPLGIASGQIPKSNFSSSSTYLSGNSHYGAAQARLGIESSWCGSDNGTWQSDWIEVKFGIPTFINGIAIERGSDKPSDLLNEFYLQYNDDGGVTYKNQTDLNGKIKYHSLTTELQNNRAQYFWFDAFAARNVRIRASKFLMSTSTTKFCLRFELFGCNSTIAVTDMFPVGLESTIIHDSAITASSSAADHPPKHARLNFPSSWCPATPANQWLQFDLGRLLLIKGITTQGDFGRESKYMVSSYFLSHGNYSSTFVFLQTGGKNKTFIGNNETSEDPVFNAIETRLVARFIRIHPIEGYSGGRLCLRLEIYVSQPDCSFDLTSLTKTQVYRVDISARKYLNMSSSFGIYSVPSWCVADAKKGEYLRIDFGNIYLVSGIAVSGSSDFDSWVTSFDTRYGFVHDKMETLATGFKGTNGRTAIAVNWLKNPKLMRYVEVIPNEFIGNKCLRVTIIGCYNVSTTLYIPKVTSIAPGSNNVLISFKQNDAPYITAVVARYSCKSAFHSQPCSNETHVTFVGESIQNNSINLTALEPWTNYDFALRFIFNDSWSAESNATVFRTKETSPEKAPNSCTVTLATNSSVTLSWASLPINDINGVLSGYQISWKRSKASDWQNVTTVMSLSNTINSLESNTGYSLQVKVVNTAGFGPPCYLHVRTLPKAPTAPQNLTITKLSSSLVQIRWNPVGSLDDSLQYYIISYKEQTLRENLQMTSPNFTYFFFNIDNQTGTYDFKVRAHTSIPGTWSQTVRYIGETSITQGSPSESKSEDTFSRNSMIALVTCASGVMFFVISAILIKAAYEKHKEVKRKESCKEHLKQLQQATVMDIIKSKEKPLDDAILRNREKLREFLKEYKSRKEIVPRASPADLGPRRYFETFSSAAQSSGRRAVRKERRELAPIKPYESPQLRKIGIDNTAFDGSDEKVMR